MLTIFQFGLCDRLVTGRLRCLLLNKNDRDDLLHARIVSYGADTGTQIATSAITSALPAVIRNSTRSRMREEQIIMVGAKKKKRNGGHKRKAVKTEVTPVHETVPERSPPSAETDAADDIPPPQVRSVEKDENKKATLMDLPLKEQVKVMKKRFALEDDEKADEAKKEEQAIGAVSVADLMNEAQKLFPPSSESSEATNSHMTVGLPVFSIECFNEDEEKRINELPLKQRIVEYEKKIAETEAKEKVLMAKVAMRIEKVKRARENAQDKKETPDRLPASANKHSAVPEVRTLSGHCHHCPAANDSSGVREESQLRELRYHEAFWKFQEASNYYWDNRERRTATEEVKQGLPTLHSLSPLEEQRGAGGLACPAENPEEEMPPWMLSKEGEMQIKKTVPARSHHSVEWLPEATEAGVPPLQPFERGVVKETPFTELPLVEQLKIVRLELEKEGIEDEEEEEEGMEEEEEEEEEEEGMEEEAMEVEGVSVADLMNIIKTLKLDQMPPEQRFQTKKETLARAEEEREHASDTAPSNEARKHKALGKQLANYYTSEAKEEEAAKSLEQQTLARDERLRRAKLVIAFERREIEKSQKEELKKRMHMITRVYEKCAQEQAKMSSRAEKEESRRRAVDVLRQVAHGIQRKSPFRTGLISAIPIYTGKPSPIPYLRPMSPWGSRIEDDEDCQWLCTVNHNIPMEAPTMSYDEALEREIVRIEAQLVVARAEVARQGNLPDSA